MNIYKVAVLGLNQGYKFAQDIVSIPNLELVAVAGFDELAKQRAKQLGVPLYEDYKQLIENVELDAVIITLPNQLHLEATVLAAQKGIHVLVEKPIASTVEEAEEIVRVCHKYNVKLLVGHHRRFSSKVQKLKEIIESGKIGDIIAINLVWALAKDRPYFKEAWRLKAGGGPILINGIHEIDTIRYVTGLKIKSVYALTRNLIRGNEVEDSASILLDTTSGVTINYVLTDGVPSPWSYDLNLGENPKFQQEKGDCYQIFGTKGSISFPSLTCYTYDEEQYGWEHPLKSEIVIAEDNDPMTVELLHFVDLLEGNATPIVTGEDALETLKVVHAIVQSAEKEEKVNMDIFEKV